MKLFLIFLSIIPSLYFAQDLSGFKYSNVLKKSKDFELYQMSVDAHKNTWLIFTKLGENDKYYYTVLDTNLLIINELKSFSATHANLKKIHTIDNQLHVFYTQVNKSDTELELHNLSISISGQQADKTIYSEPKKTSYYPVFQVSISRKNKNILCVSAAPFEEGKNESFKALVLDSNANKISENTFRTNLLHNKNKRFKCAVNDNGDAFVISKYRTKVKNEYHLFWTNGSSASHHKVINIAPYSVEDATIDINSKQNLVVAGYYSTTNVNTKAGVFVVELDPKSDILWQKKYPFDQNTLESALSKKDLKDYANTLNNYHLVKLSFLKNDQIVLVCEHHSISVDDKTNESFDIRKNMIVSNFDANGNFLNHKVITVNQADSKYAGKWNSAWIEVSENNIWILYNSINQMDKEQVKAFQNNANYPIKTIKYQNDWEEIGEFNFDKDLIPFMIIPKVESSHTQATGVFLESIDEQSYQIAIKW